MFKQSSLIILVLIGLVSSLDISQYEDSVKKMSANKRFQDDFERQLNYVLSLDENYLNYKPEVKFNCDVSNLTSETPVSVHRLKPSDVKVIAALGDSITAGVGAEAFTIVGLLIENRGVSWSIGGHRDVSKVVTVPNIFKKFNPNLKGASLHNTELKANHENLNVAVSGNEANHIPEQARNLVRLMKNSKDFDFENDWKVVTIFIGGNDLCDICIDTEKHIPERYVNDIKEGLDILHKESPRTLVNLVNILNIEDLREMNSGLACSYLHTSLCPCAAYPANSASEQELIEYTKAYRQLSYELIESGRYDTTEDFTVVIQPFFNDFQPPRLTNGKIDLSYFAPDCFHFSAKSHALGAVGLWNNMLQPVGKKATTLTVGEEILCPTNEAPFIYTNKNSK